MYIFIQVLIYARVVKVIKSLELIADAFGMHMRQFIADKIIFKLSNVMVEDHMPGIVVSCKQCFCAGASVPSPFQLSVLQT